MAAFLGIPGPPQAAARSVRPEASRPDLAGVWQCDGDGATLPFRICRGRELWKGQIRERFEMNCGVKKDLFTLRATTLIADGKVRKVGILETPDWGRVTVRSRASCLAGVLTATHEFHSPVAEEGEVSTHWTFRITSGPGRTGKRLEWNEQGRRTLCVPGDPVAGNQ